MSFTIFGDWTRTLVLLAVLLVLGFLFLRSFERRQVYQPYRTYAALTSLAPYRHVSFKTGDNLELHGIFYPAATNSARRNLVFLFCHGNAGNVSHREETAEALLATGAAVLVFDYRGYGRSEGRPDEPGTYEDAQSAYRWLLSQGFAGTNVIAFGESLGGGVAADLATRVPLAGLVLQSTFTSVPDIGADLFPWLPVRKLSRIAYDTRSKLSRVHMPVLVMHSRDDGLVGFHHAERNFAAANDPKLLWELKGSHNDLELENMTEGVEKFLVDQLANSTKVAGGTSVP